MAQGFAPFLLKSINDIAESNSPELKLEYQGYLNLLKSQKNADVVRLNDPGDRGHRRSVQIKRKKRLTVDMTDTSRSCDDVNVQTYEEQTVPLTIFRQVAFHIDDETIAQYPNDASASTSVGKPPTSLMREVLDDVRSGADAILTGLDHDLFTLAVSDIGVNRVTGLSTAKTVNFPLNTTNNPLNSGINTLLTDFQTNQASGKPQIVGSGVIHSFFMQQMAKSSDQSGLNTVIQAAQADFWYDTFAESALGTDEAIIYEPNAVQLVEYMNYQGFKAGNKGVSTFFTMMLPMQVGDQVVPIMFDVQLKYRDCPETITDAYYNTALNVEKGWSIIISKEVGLFTIEDGYRGTDVLSGNRGSYRYLFTNT